MLSDTFYTRYSSSKSSIHKLNKSCVSSVSNIFLDALQGLEKIMRNSYNLMRIGIIMTQEKQKTLEYQKCIEGLRLFNEKAKKLRNCEFTKTVFEKKTGYTISSSGDHPPIVKRSGPNEEAIDAFVLTLRFFIQDNEKSSFGNIAKAYDCLPISQKEKEELKDIRKKLNNYLDSDSMFRFNNEVFTHRNILDIFIYGGLSHANEDKKEIFDKWMSWTPLSVITTDELVYVLAEIMRVIIWIQNLNEKVLKDLNEKKK